MSRRRPRGRPPLDPDDASVSVHVRLPSKYYDLLARRALDVHRSLPAYIRRALAREFRTIK
jgi:hypothetical protein